MIWTETIAMSHGFEGESIIQVLLLECYLKKNYEENLNTWHFMIHWTGLTNRRYFTEQINQAIETAQKEKRMLAVRIYRY